MITVTDHQPIFLWGMMGTGKSSVGRALAHRLGRPFVDLDKQIEARSEKCISSVFDEVGESGFRRIEREALCAIAHRQDGAVVALGGGALLREEDRNAVRRIGPVVCLSARSSTVAERVASDHTRPLLDYAALDESIANIMHERSSAYADTDIKLWTDDQTVSDVVDTLCERLFVEAVK